MAKAGSEETEKNGLIGGSILPFLEALARGGGVTGTRAVLAAHQGATEIKECLLQKLKSWALPTQHPG